MSAVSSLIASIGGNGGSRKNDVNQQYQPPRQKQKRGQKRGLINRSPPSPPPTLFQSKRKKRESPDIDFTKLTLQSPERTFVEKQEDLNQRVREYSNKLDKLQKEDDEIKSELIVLDRNLTVIGADIENYENMLESTDKLKNINYNKIVKGLQNVTNNLQFIHDEIRENIRELLTKQRQIVSEYERLVELRETTQRRLSDMKFPKRKINMEQTMKMDKTPVKNFLKSVAVTSARERTSIDDSMTMTGLN